MVCCSHGFWVYGLIASASDLHYVNGQLTSDKCVLVSDHGRGRALKPRKMGNLEDNYAVSKEVGFKSLFNRRKHDTKKSHETLLPAVVLVQWFEVVGL